MLSPSRRFSTALSSLYYKCLSSKLVRATSCVLCFEIKIATQWVLVLKLTQQEVVSLRKPSINKKQLDHGNYMR